MAGLEDMHSAGFPGMFCLVEVESPGQELDFMPEKIESDAAGHVGEIFEFYLAEGNWLLGFIEEDGGGRVGGSFGMEDDLDVGDLEGVLVDDYGGEPCGVGSEGDGPRTFAMTHALVASEERRVDDQREGESNREVAWQFIT